MRAQPRRGVSLYLTLLGLLSVGLPASALAIPTVTFKPSVLPIEGFPKTGLIFGAGASVQSVYTINGTESAGGVPSQLRKVVYYIPAGPKLNVSAFPTCSTATLEQAELPEGHLKTKCSKASIAGPEGYGEVAAPIGGELVRERASLQAFFAPGGGLDFLSIGVAPISATIISTGRFEDAGPPYSQKLVVSIPEIPTVPGAPNASVTAINVKVGAALKKAKKTIYLGLVPKKCPKGGFPWKTELTFESGQTVTSTSTTKCPKH
jgi:hypothetical protein